jgi:transcriptional regulator with XRE-family HTH domain
MPRPINTTTRIGQLRSILGLKAHEFATLAGISPGFLRRVESGYDSISTQSTERIAFAVGVDPDWLLGGGDDLCPTRLDPVTGELVSMTRGDYEVGPVKNLTGPLNPVFERMNDDMLLRVRAALHAAERHTKKGAAYHVLDRTLGEMMDRIASSPAEAEEMRGTFATELKALR